MTTTSESNDSVKSVKDLKAEDFYQASLLIVKQIDAKRTEIFTQTLPKGMSAKVNTASDLANLVKDLGFKGDLNYHQFLYPNPGEVRKLLMWLVDAMPKKTMEASSATGPGLKKDFCEMVLLFIYLIFLLY